jgi:hypothetical protein
MRSKLPYSEYTVKELIFPYIRISYSDRINTLSVAIHSRRTLAIAVALALATRESIERVQ